MVAVDLMTHELMTSGYCLFLGFSRPFFWVFPNKACHRVSWRHLRSKHWHQLDTVITRRDSLNTVCNTRAYHSADCDTDHLLIASRLKLNPKKLFVKHRL